MATRSTIPAVVILAAALTSCAGGTSDAAGDMVAENLEAPWSIGFFEDSALISERDSARILELDSAGETREVGEVAGVKASGEGGLLGITVGPDDYLYVYSTASNGNRIQRFELLGDAGSLRMGEPEVLIDRLPAAEFHNGGRIAFGPDKMLYATVGDAGDRDSAQDIDSLSGKILRMTPDGQAPSDNPFGDSVVYSYGHRNPQGIAWDAEETMYASEFGQDTWDELNVIEAGGNYGWPEVEGIADGGGSFKDPVQQWEPADASPSGITIFDGSIYIANLRGERLYRVPVSDPSTFTELLTGNGRLRDAVTTPDGKLWIVTNNTDGRGSPGENDDRILAVEPE